MEQIPSYTVPQPVTQKPNRIKVYRSLLLHLIGAAGAIYELVTGERPPKPIDMLRQ